MAKSRKTDSGTGTPKSAGKRKPAKAPQASGEVGPIDTNLAARAAASMLLHRTKSPAASSGGSLRQIKQDLARPQQQPLGAMIHGSTAPGAKHSHLPFGGKGTTGHSHGTGAMGSRIGLPRRMGGS